jgi:hypothetical protein
MNRTDPPSIEVLDLAIKHIKCGFNRFTCIALRDAVVHIEFGVPKHRLHLHQQTIAQAVRAWMYQKQYERLLYVRHGQNPYWWNSPYKFRDERIAALTQFKQACIAAAKRKS